MDSQDDTREIEKKIINALAQGATVTAAAAEAGIHRSTIYRWMRTDACFREECAQALECQNYTADDQLTDLSRIAVSFVRDLLENAGAPLAARLRVALAVLLRSPHEIWHRPNVPRVLTPEMAEPLPDQDDLASQEPHLRIPRPWTTKRH